MLRVEFRHQPYKKGTGLMASSPCFFIPGVSQDREERVLAELADFAGATVPDHGKRIYAITYEHDGMLWKATVGECLRGEKHTSSKRGVRNTSDSDPAKVLAIFAGKPFKVVTNAHPLGNVHSKWVNPFLAGNPESVIYFSAGSSAAGPDSGSVS
jgi:hypothetical protein